MKLSRSVSRSMVAMSDRYGTPDDRSLVFLIFRISMGMDLDVRSLAQAAQRLVDHHSGIGQAKRLPGATGQQEGPMEQACPMQTVLTSGLMNCMVS